MSPTERDRQTTWHRRCAARLAAHWWFKLGVGGLITFAFFVGYFSLQRFPIFHVTEVPTTELDRLIGFCPATLILYASLWLYMPIAPWSLEDKRELVAYCRALVAIAAAGFVTFLFWPTCVPCPSDYAQHPVYVFLFAIDHRINAAPSLHAAFAVFSAFCNQHILRRLGRRAFLDLGNWCWCATILYSTLATKQHVVVDLVSGVFLGIVGCSIYPGWPILRRRQQP
jgi:hypothetical protein